MRLTAVTALSSTDVWAVGYSGVISAQTLIEHWDGTSWSIIDSPNAGNQINYLNGVAEDTDSDIHAVGESENLGARTTYQSLIMHYDGNSWSVVQSPNQSNGSKWLQSIALIGGTTSFLAVGYYENGGFANTLIEQWDRVLLLRGSCCKLSTIFSLACYSDNNMCYSPQDSDSKTNAMSH